MILIVKYCIINKKVESVLGHIDVIARSGKNIAQLSKDLVGYLRDIAVVKTCKNYNDILKYPKEVVAKLEEFSSCDINVVLNALKNLSSLEQEFRYTQNPRALFEIVMLGLVSDGENTQKTVLPQIKEKLDEKKILGNMLIHLRERKEMKLYVLMDSVKNVMLDGNILKLAIEGKDNYEVLKKIENTNILTEILKEIGIQASIKYSIIEEKDKKVNIEEKLKNQFGKLFSVEGE